MKRRFLGLTGLLGVLFATACGGGKSYEYTFTETGCVTGDKTFTSLGAMCTSLQSDSANNGCALAERMSFFAEHCTGAFTEAP